MLLPSGAAPREADPSEPFSAAAHARGSDPGATAGTSEAPSSATRDDRADGTVNAPPSEGEPPTPATTARAEASSPARTESSSDDTSDDTRDDTRECDRECVGGDLDGDDLRAPVDRHHGLRPSWSPDDLVALEGPYVIESGSPPNLLRKAAAEAFVELSDAAYAETGVRINIRSGYRTFALQCSIFRSEARNLGCAEATRASARAGFSEHQLGTTADLAIGWRRLSGDRAIDAFLDAHAHEYGWILSYPDGAEETTGYKYEPWHYRYIGREAAEELVRRSTGDRRLSTQEYLASEPGALDDR